MSFRLVAAIALLLALSVPTAQAAEVPTDGTAVPTTLYFHLLGVEDFPINTQAPDDTWSDDSLYGATTSTATCASPLAGNTGGFGNEYHTFYGFSNPATVHYDPSKQASVRAEPVRGLAADIHVDTATAATLVWYVSTGIGLGDTGPHPPMALPNVVLRATVRAGDDISIDDVAYNAGMLLMSAESRPATLAGPAAYGLDGQPSPDVKALGQVGDRWLYEFRLPLEIHEAMVPGAMGFNVRMDLFVDNPACADPGGQGYTMPNFVGMHTSPEHRPRLDLATASPMWSVMRAEMQGPHLLLLASVGSAWGAYDVDAAAAELEVTGPGPHDFIPIDVDDSGLAGSDVRSAKVLAWLWPNAMEDVNGRYQVTLRVPNIQGTAMTVASTDVALAPEGESPGLAPALVVLGLLGLAARRRRQG